MKIWFGHGSEHSSNIVMIGEFKTEEDAERIHNLINLLVQSANSDLAEGIIHSWSNNEQYSERSEQILRDLKLHNLSPADVADFGLVDVRIKQQSNSLTLHTDDTDIGAFIKLMVSNGGKVEVYSRDYYSDEESDS